MCVESERERMKEERKETDTEESWSDAKRENKWTSVCMSGRERERGWLVLRTLTVGYVGGSVTVCHS